MAGLELCSRVSHYCQQLGEGLQDAIFPEVKRITQFLDEKILEEPGFFTLSNPSPGRSTSPHVKRPLDEFSQFL